MDLRTIAIELTYNIGYWLDSVFFNYTYSFMVSVVMSWQDIFTMIFLYLSTDPNTAITTLSALRKYESFMLDFRF